MSKQANDIVNETFDKVAGLKDIANKYVDTIKGRKAIELTKELNNKKQDIAKLKAGLGEAGEDLYRSSHQMLKKMPADSFHKDLRTLAYNTVLGTNKSINQETAALKGLEKQIGKAKLNSKIARGATLAAGTAALTGAGYGISKAIKKKKEEKNAFDIVNESFDKVAGLKDIYTGKNIRNAIDDINVATNAGAFKDTIKRLTKDKNKEVAKTVGAYAIPATALAGAGAYGVSKLKKKKKEEKNAFDVVSESFEKMAGFKEVAKNYKELITGEALEKAKHLYNTEERFHGPLMQDLSALKGVTEDLLTGEKKFIKGLNKNMMKDPSLVKATKMLHDSRYKDVIDTAREINKSNRILSKAKSNMDMVKKNQTIARAGTAGALAAIPVAYGVNKLVKSKKRKEEKTAFEIVSESFNELAN